MAKVHVKKGDTVRVTSGVDRGKTAKVLEVVPKQSRIIVEGVNIVKKHQRSTRERPGGIVEQPAPMSSSKVMLVCPSCSQPTRIARDRSGDGSLTRSCKKCGKPMD